MTLADLGTGDRDNRSIMAEMLGYLRDISAEQRVIRQRVDDLATRVGRLEAEVRHSNEIIGRVESRVGRLEGEISSWRNEMTLLRDAYGARMAGIDARLTDQASLLQLALAGRISRSNQSPAE